MFGNHLKSMVLRVSICELIMAPAKRTSVKKSLVFDGEMDRLLERHQLKNLRRLLSFVSKTSPGKQISSIQFTSSRPIISSRAIATISQNVVGAPVRPNGIRR